VLSGLKLRIVAWVISDLMPVDCVLPVDCILSIARLRELKDPDIVSLEDGPRRKSQPNLPIIRPAFLSLRFRTNARNIGLIVASEAAIMPMLGSIVDHITTSSESPYQLKLGFANAGIHLIRVKDATKPLRERLESGSLEKCTLLTAWQLRRC
jgi:hypothetical protein